jgi:beta-1,2-mannobiose phosphorylase / 1,2-beta-oligomannan phosphorylase
MFGMRACSWNRLVLACILALPLAPQVRSAAEMRADDLPWHFTAWRPLVAQPVFTGTGRDTWDRKIRERGYILIDDTGIYHLWYTGYAGDRPATMSLGHATSRDGLHWERDPGNPIYSESWVEDMCIVRREGTYYMFAEGKNDIAHLLTSADGRKWTERGPLDIRRVDSTPISPGPYGTPTAWFEDGTWFLLYERGDQGIWLATSKDLKIWTNVQDNPVLVCGPESYDQAAVAVNQVVKRDGLYYAFYHANSQRPWKDWTTCVARSRDLIHWEKYSGNPLIENNCSSAILVRTTQGEDRLYTMHPDVKVFGARKEQALATPQR